MSKSSVLRMSAPLIALLALVFAWGSVVPPAHADGYAEWYCGVTVQNLTVGFGPDYSTINGRGCDNVYQTTDPNVRKWEVWADTSVSGFSMQSIFTGVTGLDRCGTGPFQVDSGTSGGQMTTSSYTSGTYGTSTVVEGTYADCGPYSNGHDYQVEGNHYVQQFSGSGYQGATGYVTNPSTPS